MSSIVANGLVSKVAAVACAALCSLTFVMGAVAPAHVTAADVRTVSQTA